MYHKRASSRRLTARQSDAIRRETEENAVAEAAAAAAAAEEEEEAKAVGHKQPAEAAGAQTGQREYDHQQTRSSASSERRMEENQLECAAQHSPAASPQSARVCSSEGGESLYSDQHAANVHQSHEHLDTATRLTPNHNHLDTSTDVPTESPVLIKVELPISSSFANPTSHTVTTAGISQQDQDSSATSVKPEDLLQFGSLSPVLAPSPTLLQDRADMQKSNSPAPSTYESHRVRYQPYQDPLDASETTCTARFGLQSPFGSPQDAPQHASNASQAPSTMSSSELTESTENMDLVATNVAQQTSMSSSQNRTLEREHSLAQDASMPSCASRPALTSSGSFAFTSSSSPQAGSLLTMASSTGDTMQSLMRQFQAPYALSSPYGTPAPYSEVSPFISECLPASSQADDAHQNQVAMRFDVSSPVAEYCGETQKRQRLTKSYSSPQLVLDQRHGGYSSSNSRFKSEACDTWGLSSCPVGSPYASTSSSYASTSSTPLTPFSYQALGSNSSNAEKDSRPNKRRQYVYQHEYQPYRSNTFPGAPYHGSSGDSGMGSHGSLEPIGDFGSNASIYSLNNQSAEGGFDTSATDIATNVSTSSLAARNTGTMSPSAITTMSFADSSEAQSPGTSLSHQSLGAVQNRNVPPTRPALSKQEIQSMDPDPKFCNNCRTTSTPSWRRCPQGRILLCNACGL
ncbi:hypothetical protein BGZ94_008758, partial [Podila epigama]